jgi:hypothetical protein
VGRHSPPTSLPFSQDTTGNPTQVAVFMTKRPEQRNRAMLGTVLLVILILLLIGALPTYPYSRTWGYGPSGVIGIILVIVLILLLTGRV